MTDQQIPINGVMGDDVAYTLATIDATFDHQVVELAARLIVETFRELVKSAAHQGDLPGTVRIRHVRRALDFPPRQLPRELFDAAIRWLEQLDEPPVEITYLDDPTPADVAAAVVTPHPGGEVYLSNQLGLIEPYGSPSFVES